MAPSCDFCPFPKLKLPLKGTRFQSREDIMQNATAQLNTIPNDAFQSCFQQWQDRWEKCVHCQGHYFEDMSPRRMLRSLSKAGHQAAIWTRFSLMALLRFAALNHRTLNAVVVADKETIVDACETALTHNLLSNYGTFVLICNDCDSTFPDIPRPRDILSTILFVPFSKIYYSYQSRSFAATPVGRWSAARGLRTVAHRTTTVPDLEDVTLNLLGHADGTAAHDQLLKCRDQNRHCDGYFSDVVSTLATKLNFRYNMTTVNTFQKFIHQFSQNNSDLGIAAVSQSLNRSQAFSFTCPLLHEDIVMAIRLPTLFSSMTWLYWSWHPFDATAWLVTAALLLALWLAQAAVQKWTGDPDHQGWFNPVLCAYLQQGVVAFPKSLSSRITLLTSYLCFWFLYIEYSAILTSGLTMEKRYHRIASMEELAFETDLPIGIVPGTYLEELMKSSKDGALREIGRRMTMFLYDKATMDLFCSGQCAIITNEVRAEETASARPQCKAYYIKEIGVPTLANFIAQKDDILAKHITRVINRMRETGLIDRLQLKHRVTRATQRERERSTAIQIGLLHVIWPMVIVVFGNVLALLTLVAEMLLPRGR